MLPNPKETHTAKASQNCVAANEFETIDGGDEALTG
jgi:hypothetical protein